MPDVIDAQARLDALDPLRSFCVTAPAGSGKTELLIQRYLAVLARVAEPEEVLAITFTRKAAAEMRARIVTALETGLEEQSPKDAHKQQTWQLARSVLALAEQRQWRLLELPSRLNIRTIDSWNAYLTRQMPVLSNFGAAASPVDDANNYYLSAARNLLALTSSGHWIADDLSRVLLYFDNNWQRLEQLLAGMLVRREQWLPHLGGQLSPELAEHTVQNSVQILIEDHLTTLSATLAGWQSSLLDFERYSSANLGRTELQRFPGHAVKDLGHWLRIGGLVLTDQGGWRKRVTKKHGFPAGEGSTRAAAAARKEALYQLIAELKELPGIEYQLQMLRFLPQPDTNTGHWQILSSLARLLPVLAAELSVVFQQEGVVDHAQIAIAANAALGGENSATYLAMKLDYRLRHILIDEFQDTSITQFDLLCRLTRNWASDNQQRPDDPNTLFIVGDGMQSIYGFRDADVSLFVQVREQGVNGLPLTNLELQTNFRSQAGLVDWIASAFASAFPSSDNIQLGAVSYSQSVAHRESRPESVILMGSRGPDGNEHASEARELLGVIATGMADEGCESIAVLVRTRKHLHELIRMLKQHNIAWQAQEIDALKESPVVADLMNLCQALHNYADDAAWLALLRAPWCALNLTALHTLLSARNGVPVWACLNDQKTLSVLDSESSACLAHFNRVIARAIARRERLPLRVWLEEVWLELYGPSLVLSDSQLDDARDFFDLLEEMDALGHSYQRKLLEQKVARLFSRPSGPNSKLQLMTLHRSKGLEFDWVIIPGLARRPPNEQRDILMWDDFVTDQGQRGFLLAVDDRGHDQATVYSFLQEQHKRRRDIEATRLLYVGCTRARERLYLSAALRENSATEVLQAPPSRSLLSPIWGVFAEGAQLATVSEPTAEDSESVWFSKRLIIEQAPVCEDTQMGEEKNLPDLQQNQTARVVGNLVHLSLQRLSEFDEVQLSEFEVDTWLAWWRSYLQAHLASKQDADTGAARVRRAVEVVLSDETGRWILSKQREAARSEWAISHVDEHLHLREYIIDRTFVDGDSRWIIDYKSAEPAPEQTLEDFLAGEEARYSPQLAAYRRAMGALDSREIKTALYFTSLGYLHQCSVRD